MGLESYAATIITLPPGQRLLDNIQDNDSTRTELPHRGIVHLEAAFTMAYLTWRDRVCTPAPQEGLADRGIARGLHGGQQRAATSTTTVIADQPTLLTASRCMAVAPLHTTQRCSRGTALSCWIQRAAAQLEQRCMEPPPTHFQRYEQQLPRGVHTVHAGNCASEILHLHSTWACYWCPPHATELVHVLRPLFIMMPASGLHKLYIVHMLIGRDN